MPIVVELLAPGATVAFQEELAARVVFRRAAGEHRTAVPERLDRPGTLRVTLRHADGTEVDLSPRQQEAVGREPPVEVLHSVRREVPLAVNWAPPPRPGRWLAQVEVALAGHRLVAPPLAIEVQPPAAQAVAAAPAIQVPGAAERVLQLAKGGALLEHALLREHGRVELAAGVRLDTLEGPAEALFAAAAVPGVDPDPPWVVVQQGVSALVRRYDGPSVVAAPPLALAGPDEPGPVWIGPPLLDQGGDRLVVAWASGARVRVALFDREGAARGRLEARLPGRVRRGAAVVDPDGGVRLLVQVEEAPRALPEGGVVLLGALAGAPPKGGRPPHAQFLWSLHLPAGWPQALPAPRRLAAVPATTHALAAHSGEGDAAAQLWGIERGAAGLEAWRLPILQTKQGVGTGRPATHRIGSGAAIWEALEAVTLPAPQALRVAATGGGALVVADTEGNASSRALPVPAPDFVGFAGGEVLVHDGVRGLSLL